MRSKRSNTRGFSLIDAIMAIVIASIALPGMLWAIRDAQRNRSGPILLDRARWLAAEKLEDVIADRHSGTRGYSFVTTANYPAESPVTGFTGFSRNVSISESGVTLTGAGTGYKTVTVTVTFANGAGGTRSFSLATVVTEYTP